MPAEPDIIPILHVDFSHSLLTSTLPRRCKSSTRLVFMHFKQPTLTYLPFLKKLVVWREGGPDSVRGAFSLVSPRLVPPCTPHNNLLSLSRRAQSASLFCPRPVSPSLSVRCLAWGGGGGEGVEGRGQGVGEWRLG